MARVIHFEINADNPEELVGFYQTIFQWDVQKWTGPEDYWLVTTGSDEEPGIDGAIMHRRDPSERTVNTINVKSADEILEKIEASGGTVIQPKSAVPGVGYMAYCQDPQGNTFGIMEEDPNAQ